MGAMEKASHGAWLDSSGRQSVGELGQSVPHFETFRAAKMKMAELVAPPFLCQTIFV